MKPKMLVMSENISVQRWCGWASNKEIPKTDFLQKATVMFEGILNGSASKKMFGTDSILPVTVHVAYHRRQPNRVYIGLSDSSALLGVSLRSTLNAHIYAL